MPEGLCNMRVIKRKNPAVGWSIALIATALLAGAAAPGSAQTIGMTADITARSVTVFDADNDIALGVVNIPSALLMGDCVVTADQTRGFVTDSYGKIFVIDLTASPPALAVGTNPIFPANRADDISITPDQKFLIATSGGSAQPVSVIDVASLTEVATLLPGYDVNSIEAGDGGSVVATSSTGGSVRRFTIGEGGVLTDTMESLELQYPNNVFMAPGGTVGVAVARQGSQIRAFAIPGLQLLSTRYAAGDYGISGLVNPAGDRVYIRSGRNGTSFVEAFELDETGRLGAAPVLSFPIEGAMTQHGMEQLAIHPDGTKLYVTQPSRLEVRDAGTGALLATIAATMIRPTGVTVAQPLPPESSLEVPVDVKPWCRKNVLHLGSWRLVPVAILSTENFDATAVDIESVKVAGAPVKKFWNHRPMAYGWDMNRDKRRDLVVFVRVREMELTLEDTEVLVEGKTLDEKSFTGKDSVIVVKPCQKKHFGHHHHHGPCHKHHK